MRLHAHTHWAHGRDVDDQGFETVTAGGRRARMEKVKQAKEMESRIKSAMARGRYNNNGKNNRNGQGSSRPPRHGNKNSTKKRDGSTR